MDRSTALLAVRASMEGTDSREESEKILATYLDLVLASKFFGNMFPGDPNGGGAGRTAGPQHPD